MGVVCRRGAPIRVSDVFPPGDRFLTVPGRAKRTGAAGHRQQAGGHPCSLDFGPSYHGALWQGCQTGWSGRLQVWPRSWQEAAPPVQRTASGRALRPTNTHLLSSLVVGFGAQHATARLPIRIVPRTAAVRRYRRSDTIFPCALKHNMLALRTLALVCRPEPENRRAPQTEATPLATPPSSNAGAWSGHARGNATPRPPAARRSSPPGRRGARCAGRGRPAPSTRPARAPRGGRRRCKRHQVVPTQLFTVRGALP